MNDPYLIQRGTMKKGMAVGMDSFVDYDYMGAAEFECGALGEALRRLLEKLDVLRAFPTGLNAPKGSEVWFVAPEENADAVRGVLLKLAEGDHKHFFLKEHSEFRDAIHGRIAIRGGIEYPTTNFWWDIENDWVAVLGSENAYRLIIALKQLKSRWSSGHNTPLEPWERTGILPPQERSPWTQHAYASPPAPPSPPTACGGREPRPSSAPSAGRR
jgi:hypothetical protein